MLRLGGVQMMRLLRLVKLTRVLKVQRFLRRWEAWIPVNFSTLRLCSFLCITFMCAHWLACGLHLVTALEPHAVRPYCCPSPFASSLHVLSITTMLRSSGATITGIRADTHA